MALWTLGIAAALAGAREDYVALHGEGLAPDDAVLACDGLGPLVEPLGWLFDALGPQAGRPHATLADLVGLGLDLDGDLRWQASKQTDQFRLELPFAGDAAGAERLLAEMWAGPVVRDGDRFSSANEALMRAERVGGALVLGTLTSLRGDGPPFHAAPTGADVPGCVVRARRAAKGALPAMDLSAFVPSQGGAPLSVHLGMSELPAILRAPPVPGRPVSSDVAPTAVMSLGWDVSWMPGLGTVQGLLPIPAELGALGAGATVALFEGRGAAVVTPRVTASGAPRSVSELEGVLAAAGGERTPAGEFKFDRLNSAAWVRAVDGELIAATSPELLADVANGGEVPWMTAAQAAHARDWPVSVSALLSAQADGGMVTAGARLAPGGVEIEVQADRSAGAALLRMASGMIDRLRSRGAPGSGVVLSPVEPPPPAGAPVAAGASRGPASTSPTLGALVAIQPGRFTMGSPIAEPIRFFEENPVPVTLTKGFLLMEAEVTQGQWRAVMGSNPVATARQSSAAGDDEGRPCDAFEGRSLLGDDLPVMCVSWLDAVAFANEVSAREGRTPAYSVVGDAVRWDRKANGYRLPTEAEWEYAARAGSTTRFVSTPEEGSVCSFGNVADATARARFATMPWARMFPCGDGYAGLAPVRSFLANDWGVRDMVGNVGEWTWNWYSDRNSGGVNPAGASRGVYRVVRGGSWYSDPGDARVALRYPVGPGDRLSDVGLRLARSNP